MENTKMKKEDLDRLKNINYNTAVLSLMFLFQAATMLAISSPWMAALYAFVSLLNVRQYLQGHKILKELEERRK